MGKLTHLEGDLIIFGLGLLLGFGESWYPLLQMAGASTFALLSGLGLWTLAPDTAEAHGSSGAAGSGGWADEIGLLLAIIPLVVLAVAWAVGGRRREHERGQGDGPPR